MRLSRRFAEEERGIGISGEGGFIMVRQTDGERYGLRASEVTQGKAGGAVTVIDADCGEHSAHAHCSCSHFCLLRVTGVAMPSSCVSGGRCLFMICEHTFQQMWWL